MPGKPLCVTRGITIHIPPVSAPNIAIRLQPKRSGITDQIQIISIAAQRDDIPDMNAAVKLTVYNETFGIQSIADRAIGHGKSLTVSTAENQSIVCG